MSVVPDTISRRLAERSPPENRPEPSNEDVRLLGAKILIVDDEPINIKVVRKHLQGAGYRNFVTTTDSTTAMDILPRRTTRRGAAGRDDAAGQRAADPGMDSR